MFRLLLFLLVFFLGYGLSVNFEASFLATDGVDQIPGTILHQEFLNGTVIERIFFGSFPTKTILRSYNLVTGGKVFSNQISYTGIWNPPTQACCRNEPIYGNPFLFTTVDVNDTLTVDIENVEWTLTLDLILQTSLLPFAEIADDFDQVSIVCPLTCTQTSDYYFNIDLSGSISPSQFILYKQFLNLFLNRFEISNSQNQFGIVTFSGNNVNSNPDQFCFPGPVPTPSALWTSANPFNGWTNQIPFSNHGQNVSDYSCFTIPSPFNTNTGGYATLEYPFDSNRQNVQNILNNITMLRASFGFSHTSIGTAMRFTHDILVKDPLRRSVPAQVFVLTDGINNRGENINSASTALRSRATIFTLGIGNLISNSSLLLISGSSDRSFFANTFEDLTSIIDSLLWKTCSFGASVSPPSQCQTPLPPVPPPVVLISTNFTLDPIVESIINMTVNVTVPGSFPVETFINWDDGNVEFIHPSGGDFNHTYTSPGNYNITIFSTEFFGSSGQSNVPIQVNPNLPPVVSLNCQNCGNYEGTYLFNVDAFDTDGFIVFSSINWGNNQTTTNTIGNLPQTFGPGNFTITVTARDNKGATTIRTFFFSFVEIPDLFLLVPAGPTSVPANIPAQILLSDAPFPLNISLSWGEGSPQILNGQNQTFSYVYLNDGNFTVTATLQENGNSLVSVSTFTVVTLNLPPVLIVQPTLFSNNTLLLNLSVTDPDSNISSIVIFWGDGTNTTIDGPLGGSFGDEFLNFYPPGNYTVLIVVEDEKGGNVTETFNLIVTVTSNLLIHVPPGPYVYPVVVPLDISFFSPNFPIVSLIIDWGDGTIENVPVSNQTAFHSYITNGTFNILVTMINSQNESTSTSTTVDILPNIPPVVNESVFIFENGTVSLTLNITDPDSNISSIVIFWGDGTNTTIDGPLGGSFGDEFLNFYPPGNYTIVIVVQDEAGPTTTISIPITVNSPPTVSLSGPSSGVAPGVFFFTLNVTDLEMNISSIFIDWDDGTVQNVIPGTGLIPISHFFVSNGTYQFILVVVDSFGSSASSTFDFFLSQNIPPEVSLFLNPISGNGTTNVTITVVATDPDGSIISLLLDPGNSSFIPISGSFGQEYTPGTYTIVVQAIDNNGGQTTVNQTLFINDLPLLFVDLNQTSGIATDLILLTASAIDNDGTISFFNVSWGDGNFSIFSGNFSETYLYPVAGDYVISVVVFDNDGGSTSWSQQITVLPNQLPLLSVNVSPLESLVPENISLSIQASDNDGEIVELEINWGDGTLETFTPNSNLFQIVLARNFTMDGNFTVTVTAVDNKGGISQVLNFVVLRNNTAPTALLSVTPFSGISPVTFTADGSQSFDSESGLEYYWTIISSPLMARPSLFDPTNTTEIGVGKTFNGSAIETFTLSDPGNYRVILQVFDNRNATSFAIAEILVLADASGNYSECFPGTNCSLAVNGVCVNRFQNIAVYSVRNFNPFAVHIPAGPNNFLTDAEKPPTAYFLPFEQRTYTVPWNRGVQNWTLVDPVTSTIQIGSVNSKTRPCIGNENPPIGAQIGDAVCSGSHVEIFWN